MKTTWRILRDPEPGDPSGGAPATAAPAENWRETIPQDVRDFGTFKDFKSPADLGKSWMSMTQMINDRPAIPNENSTPEQRDAFYKKFGRPDEASGYTLSEGTKLPEGVTIPDTILDGARTKMHELGLNASQGTALLDWYHGVVSDGAAEQRTADEGKAAEQQQKISEAFGDKTEQTVDIAKAALKKFATDDFISYLEESGLGNDVEMIRFMHSMGQKVLDDDRLHAGPGNFQVMDTTKAQLDIETLKTNKEFMTSLLDDRDAGHGAAVSRWKALFAAAYPGKEAAE